MTHVAAAPGGVAGDGAPERIADSRQLEERGQAVVWDVLQWGQPARAFALRFEGRVVAYLNRCAHVPAEMDWTPGEFLDTDRRWILCSIHGAAYEPADGRCVGGACGRGRLQALRVEERDGAVYWYPSRDTRPVVFDDTVPGPAAGPAPDPAPDPSSDPAPASAGPAQGSR